MEYLFAFGAGLLTLINPCVLPVLPIVLGSALQAGRLGPLALAAGMSLSFVALGVSVAALGPALGIYPETISRIGAILMIGFGLILLVPRLNAVFVTATAGMASSADARLDDVSQDGLRGQFLAGTLLGAVWSPCVGPTLGGAISLASQGQDLAHATGIMVGFAAGVSALILLLGYGARGLLQRHRGAFQKVAENARPILGVIFLLTGTALLLNLHYIAESYLLDLMPIWLQDLSVAL